MMTDDGETDNRRLTMTMATLRVWTEQRQTSGDWEGGGAGATASERLPASVPVLSPALGSLKQWRLGDTLWVRPLHTSVSCTQSRREHTGAGTCHRSSRFLHVLHRTGCSSVHIVRSHDFPFLTHAIETCREPKPTSTGSTHTTNKQQSHRLVTNHEHYHNMHHMPAANASRTHRFRRTKFARLDSATSFALNSPEWSRSSMLNCFMQVLMSSLDIFCSLSSIASTNCSFVHLMELIDGCLSRCVRQDRPIHTDIHAVGNRGRAVQSQCTRS